MKVTQFIRRVRLLWTLGILALFLPTVSARADAIHDAAANGDMSLVQKLLQEDAKRVNAVTSAGATPLLWAAIRGQAEVARVFVDKGADVNRAQGDGWTPLHAAVCDGNDANHVAITRLLLTHGADSDARNVFGWSPLHAAAFKGNLATMQVLAEHNAAVDPLDKTHSTPLHLAMEQGQGQAARWLIAHKADGKLKDEKGRTPLQRGLEAGKLEAIEALLEDAHVTLHLDHVSPGDALKQILTPVAVPFTLDSGAEASLTCDIKDSTPFTALRSLLRTSKSVPLTYTLRDGVLHVRTGTLLTNGGLEQNDGKQATGFIMEGFGVSLDFAQAHTGRCSARLVCDGLHDTVIRSQRIALAPPYDRPRRIVANAWVRAQNIIIGHQGGWTGGRMLLWAYDAKGEKIKTLNANGWDNVGLGEFAGYFNGTFDWREVQGNWVAPAGTASLSLEAGLSWSHGTAWLDDFAVAEAPLTWDPQEASETFVTVDTSQHRGQPIEGVGWNWSFIWDDPFEMNESPEWIDQLLHYAEWDQQSFVRFGFLAQRCLKDDWRKATPVYDATKAGSAFYERVLTGLDRLGVRILACNWQYGDGTGPYPKPPYPADRFAYGVAAVVQHWMTANRVRNLRWVSLWNEPDWWYKDGNYRGDFPGYWSALDARLRQLGLRNRLGIVGGDTTQGGSLAAQCFPAMNAQLGTAVDAFSAHDYFASAPAPGRETSGGIMEPFLRGYAATSAGLGRKPVFIGEFGSQRTGDDWEFRNTLNSAELVVGGLNVGVRGFARWAYNHAAMDKEAGFNPFQVIGGKLQPKRAQYYGYTVLTKALRPDMQTVGIRVQGGADAEGEARVHAAALTKASGEVAVVLVNDGLQSKTVHLRGLNGQRLYYYFYDATLPDGLQRGGDLASEDPTIVLKPLSINALTSWQWDRLKP